MRLRTLGDLLATQVLCTLKIGGIDRVATQSRASGYADSTPLRQNPQRQDKSTSRVSPIFQTTRQRRIASSTRFRGCSTLQDVGSAGDCLTQTTAQPSLSPPTTSCSIEGLEDLISQNSGSLDYWWPLVLNITGKGLQANAISGSQHLRQHLPASLPASPSLRLWPRSYGSCTPRIRS